MMESRWAKRPEDRLSFYEARLHPIVGQSVLQVAFEVYAIRVITDTFRIHVEAGWAVGQGDQVIDRQRDFDERRSFELWRLLDRTITAIDLQDEPMPAVRLQLDDGWWFECPGDDDGYEDWHIFGTSQSNSFHLGCNGEILFIFSD